MEKNKKIKKIKEILRKKEILNNNLVFFQTEGQKKSKSELKKSKHGVKIYLQGQRKSISNKTKKGRWCQKCEEENNINQKCKNILYQKLISCSYFN